MYASQVAPERATPKRPFASELSELTALRLVHERLETCLGALEQIVVRTECSKSELTTARFRISQVSLDRQLIFKRIIAALSLDARNGPNVQLLVRADRELMMRCSAHVGCWTAEAAAADWLTYCAASRLLYRYVRDVIGQETALLYPMLTGRGDEGPAPLATNLERSRVSPSAEIVTGS